MACSKQKRSIPYIYIESFVSIPCGKAFTVSSVQYNDRTFELKKKYL